ncbi:MAG: hypothetical protein GY757_14640, partial [bacterium]|nr:hypothetical protein [bacterium]
MKPGIKWLLLVITITILSFLPAAGEKNNENTNATLTVNCNLSGEVKYLLKKELVLTFSDDMVPLGGKRDGEELLRLTPAVKGQYLWRGTKTLVFKPEPRFAYSTRYHVTIKKGTASLTNKTVKKSITQTFHTSAPYVNRITIPNKAKPGDFANYGYIKNKKTLKNIPPGKPLQFHYYQPVAAQEFAAKIEITQKDSTKPLKITCKQIAPESIGVEFREPLTRATRYQVVFKKGFSGTEGDYGTREEFSLELATIDNFKVKKYQSTLRGNESVIPVDFSQPIREITKKNIRVYKLENRQPPTPCPFAVGHVRNYLYIYTSGPHRDGQTLDIHLNKGLESTYGDIFETGTPLTVKVCTPLPEIVPALDKEKPELFFNGVEKIEFSLIKYKKNLLDILAENHFEPGKIKGELFQKEDYIEKKNTHQYQGDASGSVRYPLISETKGKEATGINRQHGLFAFQIHQLETPNKCNDPEINDYIEEVTAKSKLIYKKEIEFVVRAAADKTLVWVYNTNTAKVVPGATVSIIRKTGEISANQWIQLGKTNRDGVCIARQRVKTGDLLVAYDSRTRQKAYYKIKKDYLPDYDKLRLEGKELLVKVFTDRIIYRPGSTIHIAGIVKMNDNGQLRTPGIGSVTFSVKDPSGKDIQTEELQLDGMGGFSTRFKLDGKCKKGEYDFAIRHRDWHRNLYDDAVRVDYYQAGTIELEISEQKQFYRKNETFNPRVTGSTLSGSPMAGDKLNTTVELTDNQLFYLEGPLEKYNFGLAYYFTQKWDSKIKPIEKEVIFDARGTVTPEIKLNRFKKKPSISRLHVEATAETKEGKEVTKDSYSYYFPADIAVGIRAHYTNQAGKPIEVELNAIDSSFKPAETSVTLTVYKEREREAQGNQEWETVKRYKGLTVKGEQTVTLEPLEPGYYLLKCDARDKDGDMLSTTASFDVANPYYTNDELYFYLRKELTPRDKVLKLAIDTIKKGTALLTVENDRVLDYYVVPLKTPFRTMDYPIPMKAEYFPSVSIHMAAIYDDGTYRKNVELLNIPGPEKRLNVEVRPQAKELAPSTQSKLALTVTDWQGKGKKSRVLVYAVNEGTRQLMTRPLAPLDLVETFYHLLHGYDPDNVALLMTMEQGNELFAALGASEWEKETPCTIGRVLDKTGRPLPGVNVYLKKDSRYRKKKETRTNKNGFFMVTAPRGGTYRLVCQKKGYKTYETKLTLETAEIKTVDVTLRVMTAKEKARLKKKRRKDQQWENETYLGGKRTITGTIRLEDGSYIPGVYVELARHLSDGNRVKVAAGESAENGTFLFSRLYPGDYTIRLELDGFRTILKNVEIKGKDLSLTMLMGITTLHQEVVVDTPTSVSVTGKAPIRKRKPRRTDSNFQLRKDFKETLFFDILETDETGKAELTFTTSDTLSTYSIEAIAYGEDTFGNGKKKILVTRDLYLEETMPEFARVGDQFRAGVRVSNRTTEALKVQLKLNVEPNRGTLSYRYSGPGPDSHSGLGPAKEREALTVSVPAKGNQSVNYRFKAEGKGEAALRFYARSGEGSEAKDALLKRLPIYDNLLTETLLDFDTGKTINKHIQPLKGAQSSKLKLKVTPSILKPAGKIAEKLMVYPYNCLEQRASRVMPYLILADRQLMQLGVGKTTRQVREKITEYIKSIPEYMSSKGLSYYKGGKYTSDYLTIYVYWSLQLAVEKGYTGDMITGLTGKLEAYLRKAKLERNNRCFYQYVSSLRKGAADGELEALFKQRETLTQMGGVFLYRAINNQQGKAGRAKTKQMYQEFLNGVQVEADFAYFEKEKFEYQRDWPFYSSRFVTALMLQAILEVEGGSDLA